MGTTEPHLSHFSSSSTARPTAACLAAPVSVNRSGRMRSRSVECVSPLRSFMYSCGPIALETHGDAGRIRCDTTPSKVNVRYYNVRYYLLQVLAKSPQWNC